MRRCSLPRAAIATAIALLAIAPTAFAARAYRAQVPSGAPAYADGPDGRILLGGAWLFRLDREDGGLARRFQRSKSAGGWTQVSVPNAWNATDESAESMAGSIGWYRKDFRLPSNDPKLVWRVRFESVAYRARVWLNGRPLGGHTGAYLPFELRLSGLQRGVNRLVVRVDSRRTATDFPPSGLTTAGLPGGGWWNYGGLLREVYLRRVHAVDFGAVQVRPSLPCPTCPATVSFAVPVVSVAGKAQRVALAVRYGDQRVDLGSGVIGPGGGRTFTGRITIAQPRLWSPDAPNLYPVRIAIRAGPPRARRLRAVAGYALQSGIRSLTVSSDGRLLINGRAVDFRGVGLHEDSKTLGAALDAATRERLVADARDLGATVLRSHYPLHPQFQELADRLGLLVWSEIPVYQIKARYLNQASVRQRAIEQLAQDIAVNQNHPSVMTWSVGNELSPGRGQTAYVKAAAALAHRLDPTRPVSIAFAGYTTSGCQLDYGPLDLIGLNDYFGWYIGPDGQIADRDQLSGYLDSVRACYPRKAIVVSEFGAEANRDGPPEEKGTWAFQQDFVNFQLGVMDSKPWLSGAMYWALREFRVRPDWDGGNPRPSPPLHQKGLLTFTGDKKAAWFDAQRLYRAVTQYGPAPAPAPAPVARRPARP